jgi:hypothetical protein
MSPDRGDLLGHRPLHPQRETHHQARPAGGHWALPPARRMHADTRTGCAAIPKFGRRRCSGQLTDSYASRKPAPARQSNRRTAKNARTSPSARLTRATNTIDWKSILGDLAAWPRLSVTFCGQFTSGSRGPTVIGVRADSVLRSAPKIGHRRSQNGTIRTRAIQQDRRSES